MAEKQTNPSPTSGKINTLDQISAGGVAFRWSDSEPQIAIVSMKPKLRWQLPKGIVDPGEAPEVTAVREVIAGEHVSARHVDDQPAETQPSTESPQP